MSEQPKMFPLQPSWSKDPRPGPLTIPWSVAEKAYGVYASMHGRGQSLERLAERGGFGVCEMDKLYPPWRSEVDEIAALRAELAHIAALRAELAHIAALRAELAHIDAVMARRPALDKPTRAENIEHALATAGQADKLQAFKTWVHAYLDGQGVPHHPPGTHGAAGCRIGDRMDWLMGQLHHADDAVRLHNQMASGEYWAWQGDGEDHLESLTCPVLIPAAELKRLLEVRP